MRVRILSKIKIVQNQYNNLKWKIVQNEKDKNYCLLKGL